MAGTKREIASAKTDLAPKNLPLSELCATKRVDKYFIHG